MTLDEIDQYCLGLPGCAPRYPFDSAPDLRAWCIGKRMFAWSVITTTPLTLQVKAHPDLVPTLVRNYDWISPGYHMNKRHWITIDADACEPAMLQGLLEDAHSLVVASLPRIRRLSLLDD